MAETIAIIGVVAAASQFTETGGKLISRLILLISRARDSPQCVQLTLDQIRMLLSLADLTKRKASEENAAWLPDEAPSSQDGPETSLQLTQASPLTWLESVWQNCSAQARELEALIDGML